MKKHNQDGFASLELILLFIALAIIGSTFIYIKNAQNKANNKASQTAQSTSNQAQKTDAKTSKASAVAKTQTPETASTPPSDQQTSTTQTAPAPKPTAVITNPSTANCLPNDSDFTVYASLKDGTPVYMQNYKSSDLLVKKVAFGTKLTLHCYQHSSWLEYREGDQPLYVDASDVSTTKPN